MRTVPTLIAVVVLAAAAYWVGKNERITEPPPIATRVEPPPPAAVPPPPAPPAGSAITSFKAAAQRVKPSVVNVYTAKLVRRSPQNRMRRFFGGQRGGEATMSLGSGVIVSTEGYILTNNHVIEGADEVAVALPSGSTVPARIVGGDPESDLAVLKVEARGLTPITFADSNAVQVGDIVLAVGDPYGVGQTVTQGIVSATGRNRVGINTFENFIQTDAAINPGNSGGALVDAEGRLIGINSAIFSESGGFQGIGFAIPVSLAREVMDQIIATGHVERGWLGVEAQDLTPDLAEQTGSKSGQGVLVFGVARGGPAARAGIRPGDVVRAIEGKAIPDAAAMMAATAALKPGTRAKVDLVREGEPMSVEVTLGRRPPPQRPS